MRFFSYESRFSQLLMKLSCSCLLNILWFICSLPIFTIGASTTALYYACLKVIRDEESHAWELFFRSFKENFKQATQLWLILLGAGLFLGADGYILYHLRKSSTGSMAVICYHDHNCSGIENTYKKIVSIMKKNHLKPCSDLYIISLINLYDRQARHRYFKYLFICVEEMKG